LREQIHQSASVLAEEAKYIVDAPGVVLVAGDDSLEECILHFRALVTSARQNVFQQQQMLSVFSLRRKDANACVDVQYRKLATGMLVDEMNKCSKSHARPISRVERWPSHRDCLWGAVMRKQDARLLQ